MLRQINRLKGLDFELEVMKFLKLKGFNVVASKHSHFPDLTIIKNGKTNYVECKNFKNTKQVVLNVKSTLRKRFYKMDTIDCFEFNKKVLIAFKINGDIVFVNLKNEFVIL